MPHVGNAGEQRGPQPPLGVSNEGAAGLEGTVPPPEPRRRLGSARLEAYGERLSAWRAGKAMACEARRAAVKHLLRNVLLTMCTINHHHSSPVALARPRPEPGRGGERTTAVVGGAADRWHGHRAGCRRSKGRFWVKERAGHLFSTFRGPSADSWAESWSAKWEFVWRVAPRGRRLILAGGSGCLPAGKAMACEARRAAVKHLCQRAALGDRTPMAGPKGVRASMRGPEEEAGWELRQGGRCRLPDTQVENRAARWRARMRGGTLWTQGVGADALLSPAGGVSKQA